MASIRPTTIPDKRLADSIDASDSSFQLDDIQGWDGNNLTSADFGSVAYAVFRDSQSSNIEIIEFDPTTIANSSITINKRGLQFDGDLTTEVSANKRTWIKGDTIVSLGTHVPQLLRHYVTTIEDQTIAGVKTFSDLPETSAGDPVDDEDLARKAYVDATATGSATTNRVVVSGNAGETVAAGDILYLDTADGEWKKADGNTTATLYNVELGIAQGAGTDGNVISGGILISGLDSNQSGFTAGDVIYISDTAGTLASSAGTNEKIVGVVKSATEIYFDPDFGPSPTADEKDALAGTGTPNSTNKYVTDDDVSDSAESGKVVRATGTALPALDGSNLTGVLSASSILGDGSDGDVTISANTQLSEDKYYSSLTIDSGAELDPNGYKIFCTGTVTVDNGKIIRTGNNGSNGGNADASNPGSGGSGGSALNTGTVSGGAAGANGSAGKGDGSNASAGGAGANADPALGKAGASGGTGGDNGGGLGNGGAGGSGGTVTDPVRGVSFFFSRNEFIDVNGASLVAFDTNGGAGGGGGGSGSSTSNGGGGGGAGSDGGFIVIYAQDIVVNASGSIVSHGGNGGDGGDGNDNGGGGGGGAGGNGGVVCLFYANTYTNNGTVGGNAGSGGSGGSSPNTAENGTAGTNGNAVTVIANQL